MSEQFLWASVPSSMKKVSTASQSSDKTKQDSVFKSALFPGGLMVKNPPANAGDSGLIPEDSTCQGATRHNSWAHVPTACDPQEKPTHDNKE